MNKHLKWFTRTAILLALTVLFQSLRVLLSFLPANVSQYIIGSLVNLCLLVAAITVGIKGGLVISVAAPVIAFLQGFTPFPVLVVPIALGNLVLVVIASLLYEKNTILAFAAAAVVKFITLYLGVVVIVLPFFLAGAPDKVKAVLSLQFSWPQLVTASIGGVLAAIILPILTKADPSLNK
ncbi:MAG: ECF transporter S component [Caldicoprobacterales bacterium]|jgi:hypothetical protein|nr:ECF transporter S component [Clostridiales bacterium]